MDTHAHTADIRRHPHSGSGAAWATRKPKSLLKKLLRFVASLLLRFDARRFLALLFQEPPRNTRRLTGQWSVGSVPCQRSRDAGHASHRVGRDRSTTPRVVSNPQGQLHQVHTPWPCHAIGDGTDVHCPAATSASFCSRDNRAHAPSPMCGAARYCGDAR